MNNVLLVVLTIVALNAVVLAGLLVHYKAEQREDDDQADRVVDLGVRAPRRLAA